MEIVFLSYSYGQADAISRAAYALYPINVRVTGES